ncbi:hypothetical protein [Kineococcus arenarius]|uniref:hypothetical protein n=1 Tax=Kineococcus sp. SYSU DK007 TaxID=3383128 RepID=UPI003D7D2B41
MSQERWWQATKKPGTSLVLGLVWAVIAIVQWWSIRDPGASPWLWLSRAGSTGMAFYYLAAWAARRSREPTSQPR